MRLVSAATVFGLLCVALAPPARAGSISLQYAIRPGPAGGPQTYDFRLTLDNADNRWVPGQGWGWVVFGDVPAGSRSPINDFALTGVSGGSNPFTAAAVTGRGLGGHNGPTLLPFDYALPPEARIWFPTAVGQSIGWSGTSAAVVTSGLKFSTIYNEGGATKADFDAAVYAGTSLPPPPPPLATTPLPAAALGGLALMCGLVWVRAARLARRARVAAAGT